LLRDDGGRRPGSGWLPLDRAGWIVVGMAAGALQLIAVQFVAALAAREDTAMSCQSGEFSVRRARLLTLVALIMVTAAIVLANSSSELVTFDFLVGIMHNQNSAERSYGWPLAWYWRSHSAPVYRVPVTEYSRPHIGFWRNLTAPWKPLSPVSRYSTFHLVANLVMWLVILAATSGACQWLLRRYRPRLHRMPRVTTLIVFIIISALTLLANLSRDDSPERGGLTIQCSYGWPMIWYRYIDMVNMVCLNREWDYSAARLVGNLVIWIAMLAAAGLAWEWLLRIFRPRLRWSLRTMLAGVAGAAMLCAWCVATRDRAEEQDAVLASVSLSGHIKDENVYFDRWGPKWLDLVGADRFRRRIVGACVHQWKINDELFERIARLPDLQFLDITPNLFRSSFLFTPGMAAALGDMRQLRMLNVNCRGDNSPESRNATHECLAAIGKLTQLKRLRVTIWEENSDDLAYLADLTKLKSLTLEIFPFSADDDTNEGGSDGEAYTLAQLPVLPRLEFLDLQEWEVGDQELGRLTSFPRLKSLDLSYTSVSDVGLAKLAPLESLEELAIDEDLATAAGFEALIGIKSLRAVHIVGPASHLSGMTNEERSKRRAEFVIANPTDVDLRPATLVLDDGHELAVLSFELDDLRRALHALRQSHPRIVIDADYREFVAKSDLRPPWGNGSLIDPFMRQLLSKP